MSAWRSSGNHRLGEFCHAFAVYLNDVPVNRLEKALIRLRLIRQRGFHRGKDLLADLARLQETLE